MRVPLTWLRDYVAITDTPEELASRLRVAQFKQRLDRLLAVRVVHEDVKLIEHAEGRRTKLPHGKLEGERCEGALAATQVTRVLRGRRVDVL